MAILLPLSLFGMNDENEKVVMKIPWVIDGAHSDRSMLHCNWGWRGASNGYFSKDCFRVVTLSSTETYSWLFRVITYDVPSTSVTRYVDF